jgi:urease accessory protein
MLRIEQRCEPKDACDTQLLLPFELRQKCRFTARIASGEEVAVMLARGGVLRDGDCLLAEDGRSVRVIAAMERVLRVTAADPQALARAAYHLGNRHAALQVGADFLQLPYDHVLAEMLAQLDVAVVETSAPFEPEAGAYGGGHHHGHDSAFRYAPVIHTFGGERK